MSVIRYAPTPAIRAVTVQSLTGETESGDLLGWSKSDTHTVCGVCSRARTC